MLKLYNSITAILPRMENQKYTTDYPQCQLSQKTPPPIYMKDERIDFLIVTLKETAKNKLLHIENPYLIEAATMLGWHISAPAYQWNFTHVIKNNGGILPFDLDYLISKLNTLKTNYGYQKLNAS